MWERIACMFGWVGLGECGMRECGVVVVWWWAVCEWLWLSSDCWEWYVVWCRCYGPWESEGSRCWWEIFSEVLVWEIVLVLGVRVRKCFNFWGAVRDLWRSVHIVSFCVKRGVHWVCVKCKLVRRVWCEGVMCSEGLLCPLSIKSHLDNLAYNYFSLRIPSTIFQCSVYTSWVLE